MPIYTAKQFQCFPKDLDGEPYVYPCLRTLAMGDSAACAYAQTAHLSLGLQSGAFAPEHLVTMHGRPPRGDFLAGLIIDDFILMEKVDKGQQEGGQSNLRRQRMHDIYQKVNLQAHPTKGFANQTEASFWGADVDGSTGLVRGNVVRAISLCWVTSKIATMGICSVNLLEIIAGGFVSLFGYRKRLMSLLDLIYVVQGGRQQEDIIRLPTALVEELWSLILLCPLAVSDLRAGFSNKIFMVDASNWGEAVVESPLEGAMAEEIHRRGVQKSAWTRLLNPWKAHLRGKGVLPPADEMPDGQVHYSVHPVWESAARCLDYKVRWKQRCKRNRHINIGELRAFVKAEVLGAMEARDKRFAIGSDSQVCLGAIAKGRSASPALNDVLRQSLPSLLGLGAYSCGGYVASALNPSDDPTRGVSIRKSDCDFPDWWHGVNTGNYTMLDDLLGSCGLSQHELGNYPALGELTVDVAAAVEPVPKKSLNDFHKRIKHKIRQRAHLKKQISVQEHTAATLPDSHNSFSEEVIECFEYFGKDLFLFGSDTSWPPQQPGLIDLFSGKKGYARSACRLGAPWALCLDIEDGPRCDLLSSETRRRVELLINAGVCLCLSAAPICSSFSRAITPCVRSKEYPEGMPHVFGAMLLKILDGNSHAKWISRLVSLCKKKKMLFWVENPDSSHFWCQPSWKIHQPFDSKNFYKCDFCTYGARWRKRTRFVTNTRLRGLRRMCNRQHKHLVLRGMSKKHKCPLTKLAEPYPRALCNSLAHAVCADLGFARPSPSSSCFFDHLRVGEAKNPGPRQKGLGSKTAEDLDNVQLIRPETVALGKAQWNKFLAWLSDTVGRDAISSLWKAPTLCGHLLAGYCKFWYSQGGALYAYRHLVVYAQRTFPVFKGHLQEAWVMIAKWEELEPVCHRRPVPYAMVRAMVSLAVTWKWLKVASVILIAFHACARPGEVLNAARRDLVLPSDIGEYSDDTCFLRINKPKPGRRGLGRVQHARIRDVLACKFLSWVYGDSKGQEPLYPGSAGAFRTRWNILLRQLGIPTTFNITPGCLRAGGTVYLYKGGTPVMDILWLMRLKNLETLQHYLQEISTDITMIDLPFETRLLVKNLSSIFSWVLSRHAP